jgi:hypothetical protein
MNKDQVNSNQTQEREKLLLSRRDALGILGGGSR